MPSMEHLIDLVAEHLDKPEEVKLVSRCETYITLMAKYH